VRSRSSHGRACPGAQRDWGTDLRDVFASEHRAARNASRKKLVFSSVLRDMSPSRFSRYLLRTTDVDAAATFYDDVLERRGDGIVCGIHRFQGTASTTRSARAACSIGSSEVRPLLDRTTAIAERLPGFEPVTVTSCAAENEVVRCEIASGRQVRLGARRGSSPGRAAARVDAEEGMTRGCSVTEPVNHLRG
jgi:hypothetical protein